MLVRLLPWGIAALYLLFLFPSPEFPPYNADDGAWFVSMGWNLAEYGRYTSDTFPLTEYGHHGAWPPLFAGFLAVLIKLFGIDWLLLKLVMAGIGLAALWLLRRLFKDAPAGDWAVLLTALSPAFFLYSHHTMTEAPYIAIVAAALLALARADSPRLAFLAGLVAVLAFFTRGYAVIFLPAGLLFFLLRPWSWRQRLLTFAAYALPLVIAVLAWKGYTGQVLASQPLDWITARFGNGAGLLNDLLRSPVEYAQRLYWHDLRYPAHFLLPLIPLDWALKSDLSILISAALLGLAGYGWWLRLRSQRGAVECWLPLALIFLLLPRTGAARYWLPFLPYLYFYLLFGLMALGRRLPALQIPARLLPHALLLVSASALAWHLGQPDRLRFINADARDYRDLALWAREHLPADAVVLAPAAQRFLAVSGRAAWFQDAPPKEILNSGRPLYLLCGPGALAKVCANPGAALARQGLHSLHRMQP